MNIEKQIKLLNPRETKILSVIKSKKGNRFKSADISKLTLDSNSMMSIILRSFVIALLIEKDEYKYYRTSKELLDYWKI